MCEWQYGHREYLAEWLRAGPITVDYQPQGIVRITVTSEKAKF